MLFRLKLEHLFVPFFLIHKCLHVISEEPNLAMELNTSIAAVTLFNKKCGFHLEGKGRSFLETDL